MKDLLHININDLTGETKDVHPPFAYKRSAVVPRTKEGKCIVAVIEIEPGKSAYPYHWHTENEEVFYIISGEGTLRTPEGERIVRPGDFIYFPPNPNGAHRLTNHGTETLKYIDFDTTNEIAVTFYPDSGKMGVWGLDVNKVYKTETDVPYYEGE